MYTDHLTEVAPGIFIREDATKATSKAVAGHYEKQALHILKSDKYHYTCMARKLAMTPVFVNEFHSVADIAGGHPKLASHLDICGEVTVYDQYAEMYEGLHDEFAKLYPMDATVKYEKKTITHHNFTPNAEVAICCHILEHLTVDQIRKLLSNLETDKVIIYGPNIYRARDRNWLHFRPDDHRTFATIDAMAKLLEEAGFMVLQKTEYQEDYLLYGDR